MRDMRAAERERFLRRSPDERLLDELRDLTEEEFEEFAKWAGWSQEFAENVVWWIQHGWRYFERPVPVREFLFDRAYMHALDEAGAPFLWPACVQAVEDICTGNYVEALLTGGIGVGKSTIGLYAHAYMLYELLCQKSPHTACTVSTPRARSWWSSRVRRKRWLGTSTTSASRRWWTGRRSSATSRSGTTGT